VDGLLLMSDMAPSSEQRELTPILDRKGKGRAYEPGQHRPSKANVASIVPTSNRHKMTPSADSKENGGARQAGPHQPSQDVSSSISPIAVSRGKQSAYGRSKLRPFSRKVVASPESRGAHSAKSSSISPITDVTRKRTGMPLVRVVSQDWASIISSSSSAPVAPVVYRTRKHKLEEVSETESDERPSRSLKRLRRLPIDVISISSDADPSDLNDSVPLKRRRTSRSAWRKVPIEVTRLSSDEDESSPDENVPLKRHQRTRTRQNMSVGVASLASNDSISQFIVADGSQPSSPPTASRDIREEIRCAIRLIRKDDTAREKSDAQMSVLIAVMTAPTDLVVTMKTGGGKSMSWMVPSVMDDDSRSIVVCPFVALLDQQYKATAATGLRCHNYCLSKTVPENVQILFLQVEHCSSHSFARYETNLPRGYN
jgi:hypothetical protein